MKPITIGLVGLLGRLLPALDADNERQAKRPDQVGSPAEVAPGTGLPLALTQARGLNGQRNRPCSQGSMRLGNTWVR
jgi:hypothetical protein